MIFTFFTPQVTSTYIIVNNRHCNHADSCLLEPIYRWPDSYSCIRECNKQLLLHCQALRDGKRLITAYWLNDCLLSCKMSVPSIALHFPYVFGKEQLCTNQVGLSCVLPELLQWQNQFNVNNTVSSRACSFPRKILPSFAAHHSKIIQILWALVSRLDDRCGVKKIYQSTLIGNGLGRI